MAVKLYDEEAVKKSPEPTYVKLVVASDGYTVYAVGRCGSDIAPLYSVHSHGLMRHARARQLIAETGHDDTFTERDDQGRIRVMD